MTSNLNEAGKAAPAGENPRPQWRAPVLRVHEMSSAAGDPTISDDGLGDGLFS